MVLSYCAAVRSGRLHAVHAAYHDLEYGFPLDSDDALFERLVLEINQAGLSWETVLKKRAAFRLAYADFSIEAVAQFTDADVERLLMDAGIIRNRLKIRAAITNAGRILKFQESHGSFKAWLDAELGLEPIEWIKLFKHQFAFMGPEIVGEFLMSSGYLPGAHDEDCPVRARILELGPAWTQ